jgi:hypothetical protein
MNTKNTNKTQNTKLSRETPDLLRTPARHASTGANAAAGDAEAALLVGAP